MNHVESARALICPNCACHLVGVENEKGVLRITCKRCRARINSKMLNPKIYVMRIIAP